MYRHLLLLLLCQAVAPAPQSMGDSDITYVMLQPPAEAPAAPTHYRESRIENLPLTIPGTVLDQVNTNLTDQDPTPTEIDGEATSAKKAEYDLKEANLHKDIENEATLDKKDKAQSDPDANLPESSNLSEVTVLPDSAPLPDINEETIVPSGEKEITGLQQTDIREESDTFTPEKSVLPEKTKPDDKPEIIDLADKDELLVAHGSDLSDTIPSESYQSERRGRTYDSSETTDIFEEATVRYEDATQVPVIVEPRTRETPKFVPKLSYFQKPQVFVSFPTNSIEKSAKRRFRSNCRCEKIWNCPKLQISVPRCPNEYFLCCF